MAKRFIDTCFYKSPFVRGLKGSLKGLYCFIICDCDASGIWNCDLEIAGVYVGFSFTQLEFNSAFVETGKAINLKNGRYFFPDFIDHQYPNGLSKNNPAHNNIIKELLKYSLIDSDLKGLWSTLQGAKVMVMDKEEVMEEVMVSEPKKNKVEKIKVLELVELSLKEIESLKMKYGDECYNFCIEKLNAYKLSSGKTYKNDYGAITSWVIDKFNETKKQTKNGKSKPETPTEYAERMYKATLGYSPSEVRTED